MPGVNGIDAGDHTWLQKGDKVECKINGTTVASHAKAEVVGAGKLESTDGLVGIRAAHNVDVNIKNFKVTK